MILTHYKHVPLVVNWHDCVDDFGNIFCLSDINNGRKSHAAWVAAYRFANGQSFEQANMRSIGVTLEEH